MQNNQKLMSYLTGKNQIFLMLVIFLNFNFMNCEEKF